ncbi:MAG: glycogen debranching protein, partial [Pseudomonadota bacterium]
MTRISRQCARLVAAAATLLASVSGAGARADSPLYESAEFTLTADSVVQGPFEATAHSPQRITTNYPRAAHEVMFKFSLNGAENEFPPGQDQMIYLRPHDGRIVTPVYTFGRLLPAAIPEPEPGVSSEEGTVAVTFRLDMREVLAQFETTGAYTPPNGTRIGAAEFDGVYIMGNTAPLTWDMGSLTPGSRWQLQDEDGDGIYTVTLPFDAVYNRPLDSAGRAVWELQRDLSRFPRYRSEQTLVDAIHNLSLEELLALLREDGGLSAGARWPEVWTRDAAWGAILAAAPLLPDEVRRSLLLKVDARGRIVQDLGTGGSWPVSTDRMAWAVAAWELYAVSGDRDWLRQSYGIVRRSAEADLKTAYDPATGLFFGESSFLDWREQSYPRWMEPKDIYLSRTLGTNALHFATYRILARMARSLGEPAAHYERLADSLRRSINEQLWQEDRGYYGQFLYGRNYPSLSPRAEGLGEAFAILFGIADERRAARLAKSMPVVVYGVPSFWPYIPDVPPYHNAGLWPQVGGFWTWAAAEAGHTGSVEHGLASLYRATALFLTNKENMVAATGHFEGTELNSDRLLGSVG